MEPTGFAGAPWRAASEPQPAARPRYGQLGIWLGLGGAVGLAAILAGQSPTFGLVSVAAGGIGYLALAEPVAALVVLLAVQWSNVSEVAGYHSGLSLYLLALALAVVSLVLALRRRSADPHHLNVESGPPSWRRLFPPSPIYLPLYLTVAASGLSLIATRYPVTSLAAASQRLKDLAFFLVALALVQLTGRWRLCLQVAAVTVAVLAGLSVVQQFVLHNSLTFGGLEAVSHTTDVGLATVRHSGPTGDPNFWGRTILLALPPSLAFLTLRLRAHSGRWRTALWGVSILSLLGGEYVTQSRGDLLAMLIVLALWIVVVAWRFRRRLVLLPIVLALVVVAVPGLSTRLGSLTQLAHVSSATTDPSLLGRVQAQEVGLAMFRANPLTGVGLGNFEIVEPRYVTQYGIVNTGSIIAPHDLYLELLAEEGVIGTAAWALFFGAILLVCARATLVAGRLGLEEERLLALSCLLGVVGWLAASLVLHMNYFNDVLALIAPAVVIDAEVRARERAGEYTAIRLPARSRYRLPRLAVGLGVTALGVALVLGVAAQLPLQQRMYRAQNIASIRPADLSYASAYTWSNISRQWLLPTLAEITANHRFVDAARQDLQLRPAEMKSISVKGVGDPKNAELDVQVTAANPATASALARQVSLHGRDYLQSRLSLYTIEPVSSGVVAPIFVVRRSVVALLVAVAVLTLIFGRLVYLASLRWAGLRLNLPKRSPTNSSNL